MPEPRIADALDRRLSAGNTGQCAAAFLASVAFMEMVECATCRPAEGLESPIALSD